MPPKIIDKHEHLRYDPEGDLHEDFVNQEENPEHLLFNSMITEYTDISGFPVKYYISKANMDPLGGEDPNTSYTEPFTTRLIYEPTEEASILDAFGISSDETLQYCQIPMDIFTRDSKETFYTLAPSAEYDDKLLQPMVGDVITTLGNDRDYEVVFARRETNIFSARKFIGDIILRPYRFSEESDKASEIQFGEDVDFFEMTTDMSGHDDVPIAPSADEPPETKAYGKKKYGDNAGIEVTANQQTNQKKHYEDLDDIMFQENPDD